MSNQLATVKKISIREAGFDENWLQCQIFDNPEILGLGDNMIPIQREKRQSSGGKLDILMQDPDDNLALYEIELMLGETDPSHIIRTLEYWDLERKRFPQRQHYAVLIAETVTRRFYNVIQLLSYSFPLIAMQVQLLEIDGKKALDFVKVMDVYQEPGLDVNEEVVDEKYWTKNADWVLKISKYLYEEFSKKENELKLNFTKSYISLIKNELTIFYLHKRSNPNLRLEIPVRNESKFEKVTQYFDEENIPYDFSKKYKTFIFNADLDFIKQYINTFINIVNLIFEKSKNVE
ncbi:hypothetical protein JEZ13_00475 [bacterium]|nr:hypothetical protein [bacterium]